MQMKLAKNAIKNAEKLEINQTKEKLQVNFGKCYPKNALKTCLVMFHLTQDGTVPLNYQYIMNVVFCQGGPLQGVHVP